MKKITIPSNVTIVDQTGKPALDQNSQPVSISFKDFVTNTLLVDPKFGKTMLDVFSAVEIKEKLQTAQETVELENADYERLLAVMTEPTNAYNPVIVIQVVSFLRAIQEAK